MHKKMQGKVRLTQGFTLIELMIAIVVVAILAAVALPSYQDSVRKTRRADAKIALEQAAAMQERWFTENNTYSATLSDISGTTSPDGNYTISMTNAGCVSGTYVSCFDLTATATGAQSSDGACATFSLDETGNRTFTGTGSDDDCW